MRQCKIQYESATAQQPISFQMNEDECRLVDLGNYNSKYCLVFSERSIALSLGHQGCVAEDGGLCGGDRGPIPPPPDLPGHLTPSTAVAAAGANAVITDRTMNIVSLPDSGSHGNSNRRADPTTANVSHAHRIHQRQTITLSKFTDCVTLHTGEAPESTATDAAVLAAVAQIAAPSGPLADGHRLRGDHPGLSDNRLHLLILMLRPFSVLAAGGCLDV